MLNDLLPVVVTEEGTGEAGQSLWVIRQILSLVLSPPRLTYNCSFVAEMLAADDTLGQIKEAVG